MLLVTLSTRYDESWERMRDAWGSSVGQDDAHGQQREALAELLDCYRDLITQIDIVFGTDDTDEFRGEALRAARGSLRSLVRECPRLARSLSERAWAHIMRALRGDP